MIEFHLERSGVPTYLQLVQQVRQAIRLGVLRPGDQLPTVKEVVGTLTINPNTVLRAYRELDLEGLIEGRRGVGTFVSRITPPPPDEVQGASLGVAALDRRARVRPASTTMPSRRSSRHAAATGRLEGRMTDAIATEGLGKRYGSKWALRDCTLEIPAGSVTALVGPNGAGKTTLLQLAIGLVRPTAGEVRVLGTPPARRRGAAATRRVRRPRIIRCTAASRSGRR